MRGMTGISISCTTAIVMQVIRVPQLRLGHIGQWDERQRLNLSCRWREMWTNSWSRGWRESPYLLRTTQGTLNRSTVPIQKAYSTPLPSQYSKRKSTRRKSSGSTSSKKSLKICCRECRNWNRRTYSIARLLMRDLTSMKQWRCEGSLTITILTRWEWKGPWVTKTCMRSTMKILKLQTQTWRQNSRHEWSIHHSQFQRKR